MNLTLKDFQSKEKETEIYNEVFERHKILIKILKDLEDIYFKCKNLKLKLLLSKEIRKINDALEKYKFTNKVLDVEIQKLLEDDNQLKLQ